MAEDCANPTCDDDGIEHYEGPNGNQMMVCEECYWELVTGDDTPHVGGGPTYTRAPNFVVAPGEILDSTGDLDDTLPTSPHWHGGDQHSIETQEED